MLIQPNRCQEYPFSRGSTHIKSPDPYDTPDFDAGFMNDDRDMAAMVWGYIKSRETARRMNSYAGEVTAMHPHYGHNSPARARDLDLANTKAYAGPNHISAGIQHGRIWLTPTAVAFLDRKANLYGCRLLDPAPGTWQAGSGKHPQFQPA